MFTQNPDTATLRQGDVVSEILFPLVRLDKPTLFLGTFDQATGQFVPITEETRRSRYETAHIGVTRTLAAVFSQDCDVDSRQEHPPPAFLVCRVLQVWNSLLQSPGYQNLVENVDPYGEEHRPYFQFFYLGEIPGREGVYLADYSQVVTIAWADYKNVLAKKLLELDSINRAKFRVKAGAHIGRATEEEVAQGIADPWHPVPPRPRP